MMLSYESVAEALKRHDELIQVTVEADFPGLHQWLLEKGHVRRNEAVLIALEAATYVLYVDHPQTTLVVAGQGPYNGAVFAGISSQHKFGAFDVSYRLIDFLSEVVVENWVPAIMVLLFSALTVTIAAENIALLVDKSMDVAAISAAFLGVFLSFKNEPKKADELWFRKGQYRKHFLVDKYSFVLMSTSLVLFYLLLISMAFLNSSSWGKTGLFVLLSAGWFALYAGFRTIVSYHLDQLAVETEKQLADRVREAMKHSSKG